MSSLYTNDTANAYTATRGTCAPMGGNVGNYTTPNTCTRRTVRENNSFQHGKKNIDTK